MPRNYIEVKGKVGGKQPGKPESRGERTGPDAPSWAVDRLPDLDDHKMRRDGAGAACNWCDRKSRGITGWITDSEYGIDDGGGHKRESCNLVSASCAPNKLIGQLSRIYSQAQLSGFVHTYLKHYLIGPDGGQIKCRRTSPSDGAA